MSDCEPLEFSVLLASPKTIFKLVTALIIILSNAVLVTVILRSTKFRRQRFHKFIVSLAFADLLIGFTIPFMTLTARENTWHLGPFLCQVFTSLQKVSLAVSTYHFLGVSLDRFFAIKMPMAYRELQLENKIIRRPVGFCWILGTLVAIPMWIDPESHYRDEEDLRKCICRFPYQYDFWVWWNFLVAFLIPGIMIVAVGIFNTIALATASPNAALYDPKTRRSVLRTFSKERRITLMMGTITVVFILCVAPYFIYFLAPGKAEAKEKILPYIVMLMYLNSLINPLLYICINSSIRKATLKLLSCQRTQEFVLGRQVWVSGSGPESNSSRDDGLSK